MKAPRPNLSLIDQEDNWRPEPVRGKRYPVCGFTFRGNTCEKKGPHYCEGRADKVVLFFSQLLVHTKGPHRRKPFILKDWQEHEIIRPLFGEVDWSEDFGMYARRFRIAYIIVARKNGKSEIAAGILLYLLLGDDEDFAEVYSAAKDTKQAGKVFEPALRMVQLSPMLNKATKHNKNARRLVFEKTASYYEIITADAAGELGHNPHGFNLDEVLALPDDGIWNSMTTAAGTRLQELLLATTTETDKPHSFGADLIDEAERVQEDPTRSPHVFAFVRKIPHSEEGLQRLHDLFPGRPDLPVSCDPMDERNWWWPNPALGDFKGLEAMRRQHLEALQDPQKEVAFKQFQGNQRMSTTFRWMPMNLYSAPENSGALWTSPEWGRKALLGREAWCGFDLSAKFDLSAWCTLFPPEEEQDEDGNYNPVDVLWRFWLPEDVLPFLDKENDGKFSKWAREGWLTVTEGDVVDYDRIISDIAKDGADFNLLGADCDEWSTWPIIQKVGEETGLNHANGELTAYRNTYDRMTPGMNEVMKLNKQKRFAHHGNPIAQFCFDMVEIRKAPYNPELIRPDKPERDRSGKRIDAVPTAAMACAAWATRGRDARRSAYDDRERSA